MQHVRPECGQCHWGRFLVYHVGWELSFPRLKCLSQSRNTQANFLDREGTLKDLARCKCDIRVVVLELKIAEALHIIANLLISIK